MNYNVVLYRVHFECSAKKTVQSLGCSVSNNDFLKVVPSVRINLWK